MDDEVRRAWELALAARSAACRTLSKPLIEDGQKRQLEGAVNSKSCFRPRRGPVTTDITCANAAVWVIDYDEQSPYQAFIGRRVVASGFPCHPPSQHRIGVAGHFAVSSMQLADAAPDAWLLSVGPARELTGCFEYSSGAESLESELCFRTESNEVFGVVNHPAGMALDNVVKALAYPVEVSPRISRHARQALWVICPWSYGDLGTLRDSSNGGLPAGVYFDAERG